MDVTELMIGKQLRAGDLPLRSGEDEAGDRSAARARARGGAARRKKSRAGAAVAAEAAPAEPEVIKKGKKEEEGEEGAPKRRRPRRPRRRSNGAAAARSGDAPRSGQAVPARAGANDEPVECG